MESNFDLFHLGDDWSFRLVLIRLRFLYAARVNFKAFSLRHRLFLDVLSIPCRNNFLLRMLWLFLFDIRGSDTK